MTSRQHSQGKFGFVLAAGALGCLPQARYLAGEGEINDGDTLILYTDGVSEAV